MGAEAGPATRGVVFPLDVSPSEERLLLSYCGARRFAYNWALGVVRDNLGLRRQEREAGVAEGELTPALSWSARALGTLWNHVKEEVAPWWREVSMHAFRSGIVDAAAALQNWADSRSGARKGRRVGFPRFKKRDRSVPTVSFVEINHQLSWLHPDRHHVRLMLPRSTSDPEVRRRRDQLAWLHTTVSTRPLYNLVDSGKATIQKVTLAKRGGRWQASLLVRYQTVPVPKAQKHRGGLVGVDVGVKHLATLSDPVGGVTDTDGHVTNPNVLAGELRRLVKLDRAVARAQTGSKNRRRLVGRRARLYGRITKTRALYLHQLTNLLAGGFDIVAIEDLNVAGMANRTRRLGRALADVSLGELARQLAYKTTDHNHRLVTVDRFYPSSKSCSACGTVRAKLPLRERIFKCDDCGLTLDRDVNAARNIANEASRILEQQDHTQRTSPGYDRRRKTLTGDHRRPARPAPGWQRSLERQNQAAPTSASGGGIGLGRGDGNDARSDSRQNGTDQAPSSLPAAEPS